MEQNLGIDTKIKSVGLSDPNYNLAGVLPTLLSLILATNGQNGHSGQSEVSESDPNCFPMPQSLASWG